MEGAANGTRPKIPGVTVSMGGQDWVVPPLTLGQMRRLEPLIEKVRLLESTEIERTEAIAEVAAVALSRNYNDMTPARLIDDLLDLGNFVTVFNATLAISGLVPRGEEIPAASAGEASGLGPSIPLSPPGAAGPTGK